MSVDMDIDLIDPKSYYNIDLVTEIQPANTNRKKLPRSASNQFCESNLDDYKRKKVGNDTSSINIDESHCKFKGIQTS